ncbi:MAG TPA: hypothetical protein VGK03_00380 [Geothrix sp.]|jgi:hypothetical protein
MRLSRFGLAAALLGMTAQAQFPPPIARPENRMKFYAAAEAFLSHHLGGRAEAPSDTEKWDALKK